MITKEQAIDILDKFDFFQGQRAGRELWNDKPYEVQEEDIKAFSRDIAELKAYIADVVPKSEVEELTVELGAMRTAANSYKMHYENAKAEVEKLEQDNEDLRNVLANTMDKYRNCEAEIAREIFEELVREVYSKIPDKILPVTFGEMSRHLDYNDGLNFGSRNAYFDTLKIIAELKKKYTEVK